MKTWLLNGMLTSTIALLALSGVASAQDNDAQVTIENLKNVEVSQERVNLAFATARRVVAEEFHIRDSSQLEFPLVLVLGEPREHYAVDDNKGVSVIYLVKWNEAHFVSPAMMLVVHHLISPKRHEELVLEILRRTDRIAPVSVSDLRKPN